MGAAATSHQCPDPESRPRTYLRLIMLDSDGFTVVIADDDEVARDGLRRLVQREHDLHVIDEVGNADAALRSVQSRRPDVLVLDVTVPRTPSLELLPEMLAAGAHVVVLTRQSDPALARQALRTGASAFVVKESAADELVRAIRAAVEGRMYLTPELGARLAAAPPEPSAPPDGLSNREAEVLRFIALGYTNAEISDRLFLSVRTVETHRATIQRKLGRSTRAELVRFALDHGLVA